MRKIMNISLPEDMAREIKKGVKAGHFSSVSEFIRAAVREYQVRTLLRDSRKAHRDYINGRLPTIDSLKDLR